MKEYQARAPNGKVINGMLVIKPGANRNPAPQLPALHLMKSSTRSCSAPLTARTSYTYWVLVGD